MRRVNAAIVLHRPKNRPKGPPKGLLDDDDDNPIIAPTRRVGPPHIDMAARKGPPKGLLDDDDDAPAPAKPAKNVKPLVIVKQVANRYMNVQCGEDRVLIVDRLDKSGGELLCYNYRMGCTIHLKRQDLQPADLVAECIALLETVRNPGLAPRVVT